MKKIFQEYDVAIVGAGIAGLFAGCLLAKSGLKCAIFEAHYIPGGCVQGFKRDGFYFDAGAHLIGSINNNALLNKLLRGIGIEYPFIKIDPVDRIHYLKRNIAVPLGWNKYRDQLSDEYPNEKSGLINLFEKMELMARYCGRKNIADKYGPISLKELLDSYIADPDLKHVLGSQWGFLGETPENVSALSMAIMLVGYIRDGAGYAKGGSQRLCNVLANTFRSLGGKLFLSTPIERVETKGRFISHLTTNTQKHIKARHYVWTASPISLYENSNFQPAGREMDLKKRIYSISPSIKIYSLFLGLNLDAIDLRGLNGWHYLKKNNKDSDSWLYLFSPSYYDKSLAPKGKSTLVLSVIYADSLVENEISLLERRKAMQKKMIKALSKIILGLEEKILILEDGMPETFFRFTKNTAGSIYGWAPRADNYFDRQLVADSNILDNVSLAGHWTMPGPGVPAVAMSAYMVCEKIRERLLEKDSLSYAV